MSVKLGNTDINGLFLGNTTINQAFLGNIEVFTTVIPNGLLNNLVTYYKMDTNGSMPDAHGSNNGIINGATFTASGKINGGYILDGANDFINTTITTNYSAFTTGCWFKSSSTSSVVDDLIGKWDDTGSQRGYVLRKESSGALHFFVSSNGAGVTSDFITTNTFNDGVFHLVELVNYGSGGSLPEIWVDGVKQAGTQSGPAETPFANTLEIIIGALNKFDALTFFNGTVDEWFIYSAATTTQQKADRYNGGAGLAFSNYTN